MDNYNSFNIYSCRLVKESEMAYRTKKISTPYDVYVLAEDLGYTTFTEEHFGMLCLDVKGNVVGYHQIAHGGIAECVVDMKSIFKRAILNNASAIILLHNHPSGSTAPSESDLKLTEKICEAGEVLNITVADHVVIGDGAFCSFKELGYIS